ncbi:N-acetyltransferase family protein, partial [Leptospira sp. SA-E8]|uniref:GNAT family N-acetyltransferase n=1 Tax=Leptospira sp. SA-E8 TaxID=3422259 RepID=UPI003EBC4916
VDPMPKAEFAQVLGELVATRCFYVVEKEGRVRGFYRTRRQEGRASHVAYIGTFAVAPSEHGSGFAASIIETVVARLQAEGVRRIELMLEADNPRALGFYRKLGFEHEGTLRAAYKRADQAHYVDELLMAKLLPPLAKS